MSNEIKEDYCSFEMSKLLKEKGFNCECNYSYELALKSRKDKQDGFSGPFGYKKGELNISSGWNVNYLLLDNNYWFFCSRPTHGLAIKWVIENLQYTDIWIEPFYSEDPKLYTPCIWYRGEYLRLPNASSKEEATEAALTYSLNNLMRELKFED